MKRINCTCIIDDDPLFIFGMKILLKELGTFGEVLVCEDGQEGLETIAQRVDSKEALPELIFLDLNMPIMDGWEFLDDFGKFPEDVRKGISIYIVSSSIDPRDLERTKTLEFVKRYILKPVTAEDLASVLAEVA